MTTFSLRMSLRARAWIALLAMLALALLPALSQAMAATQAGHAPGWATLASDICSAQPANDTAATAEPGSPAHAAAHLQHCAACLISVDVVGLLPQPLQVVLAEPANPPAQASTDASPRSQPARRGHQPRAPPALS